MKGRTLSEAQEQIIQTARGGKSGPELMEEGLRELQEIDSLLAPSLSGQEENTGMNKCCYIEPEWIVAMVKEPADA